MSLYPSHNIYDNYVRSTGTNSKLKLICVKSRKENVTNLYETYIPYLSSQQEVSKTTILFPLACTM